MKYYTILNNINNCIKLNKACYLNPKLCQYLVENFESINEILENTTKIKENFKINIDKLITTLNSNIEKELNYIKNNNIQILTQNSNNYPKYLKEITNYPLILFTKGNIDCLSQPLFSIIGTRKPTEYASITTASFTASLSNYFCIVSGLAMGIDTIAHQTCVNQNKLTIAILAHGIDSIYPKTNTSLANKIINSQGLLISEFPLFSIPQKFHFPQRNRIISGLSQGLLLSEATIKSGSMITANYAIEQNREIFALPGNITNKNAEGPIHLIQQGAKCVFNANDIFEEFNLLAPIENTKKEPQKEEQNLKFSSIENKILSCLTTQLHIDEIKQKTQLELNTILHTLTFLEIKSAIKKTSANSYIKT